MNVRDYAGKTVLGSARHANPVEYASQLRSPVIASTDEDAMFLLAPRAILRVSVSRRRETSIGRRGQERSRLSNSAPDRGHSPH